MTDKYCREEFEKALKTIEKQTVKIKKLGCELQNNCDIIGKQTYELSVLRNGLERLKTARDWQSAAEVDAFFDKLLEVVRNEK